MSDIKYRILEHNRAYNSFVIRYYAEDVPEDYLKADDNKTAAGYPVRCITDCNITIHNHDMTKEQFDKYVKNFVPHQLLEAHRKLRAEKRDAPPIMDHIQSQIGVENTIVPDVPVAEEEIESLIDRLTKDKQLSLKE